MGSTQTITGLSSTSNSRWARGCDAIARGWLWNFLLIFLGSASSVVYPHPPLVSFATIAGATLTCKKAAIATMAIWLVNQVYGYSLRDYPRTSESIAWGLIMGLGTLLVALLASLKPKFSREKIGGHFLWLGVSFVGGFILFEGLILLTGIFPGISHNLTPAILMRLLIKESIWIVPLALAHMFLVRRSQIVS
ncbi:hypothetical protein [Chroococcidiopsis thermalis]|uniref:Uncharacterized protein n=1 Tax=Chroococcidiopsis thermalis (strain PCC 7203) TaxID=251229 RepID=K9U3J5_CHRTP|nr:hypothetical protein [Chroococcidiopsis thermalis]AFY89213.1 hypothetical protein Chro_3783 [Chroococcidiopsis thermalis PCC 7203]